LEGLCIPPETATKRIERVIRAFLSTMGRMLSSRTHEVKWSFFINP
jgi:hypothetical protein